MKAGGIALAWWRVLMSRAQQAAFAALDNARGRGGRQADRHDRRGGVARLRGKLRPLIRCTDTAQASMPRCHAPMYRLI